MKTVILILAGIGALNIMFVAGLILFVIYKCYQEGDFRDEGR